MLKVLIIDDEPEVRAGIKTIIDWGELGFEVCGEAEDGAEGLEQICKLNPDLVLVDIKMPEMNGITMIEEARLRGYKCEIILLTGFSDFTYAQSAIKFGIAAYLLKPIDEDELIVAAKECFKKITANIKTETKLNASKEMLINKALAHLILGKDGSEMISEQKEIEDIKSRWRTYQVVVLRLWSDCRFDVKEDIIKEIAELIANENYGYVVEIDSDIVILLKDRDLYNYKNIRERIIKYIEDIFDASDYEDYSIAIGKLSTIPNEIVDSYNYALDILRKRFLLEDNHLVADKPENMTDGEKYGDCCKIADIVNEIYSAVTSGNAERTTSAVNSINIGHIINEKSEKEIRADYINIYFGVIELLKKGNYFTNFYPDTDEAINKLSTRPNLKLLGEFIREEFIFISQELDKNNYSVKINKILDYINKNYSRDLKLEEIAELFNYNSAYLGRLLKKQTGEYFKTYLDIVRIEKSKELLLSGLKVYDVAKRVGYNNINYFNSKFKNRVGLSPSSFKKQ